MNMTLWSVGKLKTRLTRRVALLSTAQRRVFSRTRPSEFGARADHTEGWNKRHAFYDVYKESYHEA